MKHSKVCPKCNGTDIYTDAGKDPDKRSDRGHIRITKGHGTVMFIDIYTCIGCGYMEEYVCPSDLKDPEKIELIKNNWTRIK